MRPAMFSPADHNGWPEPRPFFAARDTHTNKMQVMFRQLSTAPACVMEVRVAAVNDRVTGRQQRQNGGNHDVHRLCGRDHEQDYARRLQAFDKVFQGGESVQVAGQIIGFFDELSYP